MIRKLIVIFFVYLIVEGALRKWLFPAVSAELFILKDVILLFGFVAFLGTDLRLSLSYLQRAELALWGLWLIFVVGYFLLRDPSLARVAGLRYYLAPLPLLLLIPYVIDDVRDLDRMAVGLLIATIPLCVLGFVQYLSPADAEINRYAWVTAPDDISTFGVSEDHMLRLDLDRPRITSTFSYISTYAAYLTFAVLMAWAVLASAASAWHTLLGSATLLLVFTNLAMTGSRGAMAMAIILSVPFAKLLLTNVAPSRRPLTAALVLLPVCAAFVYFFLDPFEALLARVDESDDTWERVRGLAFLPVTTLMNIEPLGGGIGATFAGIAELGETGVATEGFREVIEDRTGVELGYLGYFIVLVLKIYYLAKSWALYRNCARVPDLQVWALTSLAVQLSSIWQIPFHNAISASFYFAALGLFVWVRKQYFLRTGARIRVPRAQRYLVPNGDGRTGRW